MRRSIAVMVGVLALGGAVVACGSNRDDASTSTSAPGSIEISDPWCRTSAAMADNGACYMQIANDTAAASALVSASVPTSVAGTTELHETTTGAEGGDADMGGTSSTSTMGMSDDSTTSSDMGSGMMGMRPVDSITLPAHQTVSLEPGGYHVMLLALTQPLAAGANVELTLTFEGGATQTVEAAVRDQ